MHTVDKSNKLVKKKDVRQVFQGKDPRKEASFWQLINFSYVLPLIEVGYTYNEKLKKEQMGVLPESISIDETVPLLEDAWKEEYKKEPESYKTLVKVFFQVFKWRILARFIHQIAFKLISMLTPLLIFNFTEFVEKDEAEIVEADYTMATIVACGIVGLELVERFGHAIFDFHQFKSRTLVDKAVKIMIFNKNFRMSSTGKRDYTFAQVINLVNTESNKILETIHLVSDIIMTPFEIAYCAFFIYYYLGWSIISGLLLWLLRFFLLKLLKENKVEYYAKLVDLSDKRLQKTTESFMNIKTLKLYGWENKF